MSDTTADVNASTQDGNQPSGDTSAAGDEFKPITSQEDLNRVLNDRLVRERAKFQDYKDLKEKASRLDQIEQANKTEAEKTAERIAQADAAVAKVPQLVAEQLRTHLISMHSISDDDAELFLTATETGLLIRQVDRLVARQAETSTERKKQGNHVPREGTTTSPADNDERAMARAIFSGGD